MTDPAPRSIPPPSTGEQGYIGGGSGRPSGSRDLAAEAQRRALEQRLTAALDAVWVYEAALEEIIKKDDRRCVMRYLGEPEGYTCLDQIAEAQIPESRFTDSFRAEVLSGSRRCLKCIAATAPTGVSLRAELAEAKAEMERLRGLLERAEPHITNSMINPRNNDDWYRKGKQLRADIAALADAATPTHEHTYDSDTKLALVAGGFVRFCDTCGNAATPEKTHSSGCRDCRWDGRHWHLCENHYRATRLAAMDEPTPDADELSTNREASQGSVGYSYPDGQTPATPKPEQAP